MVNTNAAGRQKLIVRPHAYSWLLLSLAVLMFFGPVLVELQYGVLAHGFSLMTTLAVAIYGVGDSGTERRVIICLGLSAAVAFWGAHLFSDSGWLGIMHDLTGLAFYGYVAYILLRDIVAREADVTLNMINGAVAVYLVLGILFAYVFGLLHTFDPGSFSGVVDDGPTRPSVSFYYFSMVTLTTLGYGDILPLKDTARGFSMLEVVLGQIYLTVLVARLVGLHISAAAATTDTSSRA